MFINAITFKIMFQRFTNAKERDIKLIKVQMRIHYEIKHNLNLKFKISLNFHLVF